MDTTLTPPGGSPITLVPTEEPSYTLAEQGGFRSASIKAPIKDPDNARLGHVSIGDRYLGDVQLATKDELTVQGKQAWLEEIKHGRIYVTRSLEYWDESQATNRNKTIDVNVTEEGTMVWTWDEGRTYAAGAFNGRVFYLPERQALILSVAHTLFGTTRTLEIWGGTPYALLFSYTNQAAGTKTVTVPAGDKVAVYIRAASGFTAAANSIVTLSNISLTHTAGAGIQAVLNDICDLAGPALVPMRDIDPTLSHTFDELLFPADTSIQFMIAAILAHGDWRVYLEARTDDGIQKPCLVAAKRPTTAAYALSEGEGVIVNLEPISCDPLASVLRCFYTTVAGVRLFEDVVDDDVTHYLVAKGFVPGGPYPPKMKTLETGQTTSAGAIAIGRRWFIDGGRDQRSGTVRVEGAPNGRNAEDYREGELLALTLAGGDTVTIRITEGTYVGKYLADLTLDSTPNTEDVLAQLGERMAQTSRSARQRLRGRLRIARLKT